MGREAHYPMDIRWSEEDGLFLAEVFDLPGCMADGQTQEEAAKNAREAARLWIEVAKKEKRRIPPPSAQQPASGKFVVRLPKSLHARLQTMARHEAVSLNQLVLSMIAEKEAERRTSGASH
jgi:predicted RNase H-like HicB family nuclease